MNKSAYRFGSYTKINSEEVESTSCLVEIRQEKN